MDERIQKAVKNDRWIDITTLGRKTGQHRRIEIGIHQIAGEYYITSTPGKRSWYANVLANPQFIIHFKENDPMDVRAQATPITDEHERREIFKTLLKVMRGEADTEEWIADSKLVRLKIL